MPSKKQDQASYNEAPLQAFINSPPQPERQTKQALLLELMGKEGGATLEDLTNATGWLPHTARAAMTGLRKRGHDVRRERVEGVSRYILRSGGQ